MPAVLALCVDFTSISSLYPKPRGRDLRGQDTGWESDAVASAGCGQLRPHLLVPILGQEPAGVGSTVHPLLMSQPHHMCG